jgi:transposase
VGSKKISNGKKKGCDNTKNGNKYLSWAFIEAANFAVRFSAKIKSFKGTRVSDLPYLPNDSDVQAAMKSA